MKNGRSIVELAQEIQRQSATKKDFIADTQCTKLAVVPKPEEAPQNDTQRALFGDLVAKPSTLGQKPLVPGSLAMQWNGHAMPVTDLAHGQIATRFNIPKTYYDRMKEAHPDILADTVTKLMHREPQNRMVRTMDNTVRAFLSAKYRGLDNDDLFEACFPVLQELGVKVVSAELTARKLYIKFLYPDLREDCPDLMPAHYGNQADGVAQAGEFAGFKRSEIIAGGVIHNSEVGLGSIGIKDLDFNLWCLNGCVRSSVVRQTHIGRAADIDAFDASEFFRDETRMLKDAAFFSAFKDTLKAMFSKDRFQKRVDDMRRAKGDVIEEAASVPEVVEVIADRFKLTEGVKGSVLDSLIRDGDLSRWGVSNAITAVSQKAADYDDASSLEEVGGKVIELGQADWKRILTQASRLAA